MDKILAIDLGKFKSVACFYETKDNTHRFKAFKTNKFDLYDVIMEYKPDCVVIEVCSISGWVHDLVCSMGIEIKVANTNDRRWSWSMTTIKTDRRDALRLAQLTQMGQLPTVHTPEQSVRQKRLLINYRQSISQRLTQSKNNIRAILDSQAIEMPPGRQGWSQKSIEQLRQMARPIDKCEIDNLWRGQLYLELTVLEQISEVLLSTEQKLQELNRNDNKVKLLQTIPGVGPRLAEAVAAYLDEPDRFDNGKQVGCYIGLTPRQFQSGNIDRQGRISGQGNKLVRSLLVEVCWLALRWNPWVRQSYERIRKGSGSRKKIAIIAVARRLLVRMWAMLRDGTKWQPPTLESSQKVLDINQV